MTAIITSIIAMIPWDTVLPIVGGMIWEYFMGKTKVVESNSTIELAQRSVQRLFNNKVKI